MPNHSQLWRRISTGATWTELTAAGSRAWQDFDLVNDRTKIVGFADHIYVSTDSGSSWGQKTTIGTTYSQDSSTRCKVSTDGVYYHGFGRSSSNSQLYIYCSTNSGSTFSLGNNQNATYSGGFDALSNGVRWFYYISTGGASTGIYRRYFTPNTNEVNNGGEDPAAAQALAVADTNGARVIAAGNNIVRVSSDSGNSFTNYTNSFFIIDVASNDAGDQAIAALSGTAYLKESTDYGVSWADNTAAGSRVWKGACISDSGTIRIAWTASLILRSTDSGASWTDITFPGASSITRCGLSGDGLSVISSNNSGYPRIINF